LLLATYDDGLEERVIVASDTQRPVAMMASTIAAGNPAIVTQQKFFSARGCDSGEEYPGFYAFRTDSVGLLLGTSLSINKL